MCRGPEMATATKRGPGRPPNIVPSVMVRLRVPASLVDQVQAHATAHGLSASEVWRRAVVAWLGRTETPERDE